MMITNQDGVENGLGAIWPAPEKAEGSMSKRPMSDPSFAVTFTPGEPDSVRSFDGVEPFLPYSEDKTPFEPTEIDCLRARVMERDGQVAAILACLDEVVPIESFDPSGHAMMLKDDVAGRVRILATNLRNLVDGNRELEERFLQVEQSGSQPLADFARAMRSNELAWEFFLRLLKRG